LCSPRASRFEARSAQLRCRATLGERSQGASLKPAGRPSLARAAWSPRSRFSYDHAARATLDCSRRPGGRNPEGRRTGYPPEHDHPPNPHNDSLPSWSSAVHIAGSATAAGSRGSDQDQRQRQETATEDGDRDLLGTRRSWWPPGNSEGVGSRWRRRGQVVKCVARGGLSRARRGRGRLRCCSAGTCPAGRAGWWRTWNR